MKKSGKPDKKDGKSQKNKSMDHGSKKPLKSQKIIKGTVRGR